MLGILGIHAMGPKWIMDRHEREIIGILHYPYKNNRFSLLQTTARRTLMVFLQSLSRVAASQIIFC